ncbi:MAG: putative phage tail protein [Pseudomonadota bacterium]
MNHTHILSLLLPSPYDATARILSAELNAEGNALDAASSSADSLLSECDPRIATQLLSDWERVFGNSISASVDQRRAYVAGRVAETGGQSKTYFTDVARNMGYVITIDEFIPCNIMHDVMYPLCLEEFRFVWRINAHATATAAWVNDFEAAMLKDSPAHTKLIFTYQ